MLFELIAFKYSETSKASLKINYYLAIKLGEKMQIANQLHKDFFKTCRAIHEDYPEAKQMNAFMRNTDFVCRLAALEERSAYQDYCHLSYALNPYENVSLISLQLDKYFIAVNVQEIEKASEVTEVEEKREVPEKLEDLVIAEVLIGSSLKQLKKIVAARYGHRGTWGDELGKDEEILALLKKAKVLAANPKDEKPVFNRRKSLVSL